MAASSNETPCLRRFAAAFRGSHVYVTCGPYVRPHETSTSIDTGAQRAEAVLNRRRSRELPAVVVCFDFGRVRSGMLSANWMLATLKGR